MVVRPLSNPTTRSSKRAKTHAAEHRRYVCLEGRVRTLAVSLLALLPTAAHASGGDVLSLLWLSLLLAGRGCLFCRVRKIERYRQGHRLWRLFGGRHCSFFAHFQFAVQREPSVHQYALHRWPFDNVAVGVCTCAQEIWANITTRWTT